MATFQYTGSSEREFPTLVLTVKPGDTFDAPADFVAADVIAASAKKAPVTPIPSAPSDSTQGA